VELATETFAILSTLLQFLDDYSRHSSSQSTSAYSALGDILALMRYISRRFTYLLGDRALAAACLRVWNDLPSRLACAGGCKSGTVDISYVSLLMEILSSCCREPDIHAHLSLYANIIPVSKFQPISDADKPNDS